MVAVFNPAGGLLLTLRRLDGEGRSCHNFFSHTFCEGTFWEKAIAFKTEMSKPDKGLWLLFVNCSTRKFVNILV